MEGVRVWSGGEWAKGGGEEVPASRRRGDGCRVARRGNAAVWIVAKALHLSPQMQVASPAAEDEAARDVEQGLMGFVEELSRTTPAT